MKKHIFAWFSYVIVFLFSINITCQELIRYDQEHLTAKIHFQRWLYLQRQEIYKKSAKFPAIGTYSPTGYSMPYVRTGVGLCNYIYIETKNQLKPGLQYHLSLTVKLPEEYGQMPYYQKHFGIALSSDLFENEFGLWAKHFIPLKIKVSGQLVTINLEFRPLCSSKYIILGVFQGPTMGNVTSFLRKYDFELHSLIIKKSPNTESDFYYICNGFVEKNLNKKWNVSYSTDTVFFDSGSAVIKDKYLPLLDSIPSKLRTKQDIVSLYAFTDAKGSDKDNKDLGIKRNLAVRDELIKRGIDSIRILMTNYGESKSSNIISQANRKVEIDVNLGKLYQKYFTEALQAANKDDFGTVNKKIRRWLHLVPPKRAIYALFDCWGSSKKVSLFKRDLHNRIKRKFYKGKALQFTLDSLYCESLKGKGLKAILTFNHLVTYQGNCDYKTKWSRTNKLLEQAEKIYLTHGIPTKNEVGKLGNITLPEILLSNYNLSHLQKYLPLFKKACEKQKISWYYFAKLYDKISVKLTGFQRYGTQIIMINKGTMSFLNPVKDIGMLNEYRKQMKLVPYPDNIIEETRINQKQLDTTLVTALNKVYQLDQNYRFQIDEIEDKYGEKSDTMKAFWKLISKTDSLNLIKVIEILDNRGWLSPKVVGNQGSTTLFLVIQHSDLKTQIKYLPMIREAVKQGNAKADELALLEDRVAVKQRKKQIYGSQIGKDDSTGKYYIYPVIEPEKVNERRAKAGLQPIEEYLRQWGIKWDDVNYKDLNKE